MKIECTEEIIEQIKRSTWYMAHEAGGFPEIKNLIVNRNPEILEPLTKEEWPPKERLDGEPLIQPTT